MAQSVINVLKSQGLAGKVAVSGQDATAGGPDNVMAGTHGHSDLYLCAHCSSVGERQVLTTSIFHVARTNDQY